ncbi:FERM, ARHGEF and pleckstrin domain-containing protein 1, variant 2 [Balamuthia mandrillaris]
MGLTFFTLHFYAVEAYSQSKDAGPAKQRWRTLMDLITSEREYVAALSDCIQNYLRPLQEAAKPDNKQGHGLTMQELSIVFRNIELIHSLHVHLLAELEERVIKSTTATTTGTSFMCIGDIMLKVLPSLSIYAQYHKKRHHAFEMYCAWVARTDFANSTLAPLQKDKESSLIVSLDRPLERVSQYRSFLQKLLRYTPSTHVDRPRLVEARSATSSLLQLLEESWEFGRTKYKMRSLQHILHGLPPLITTTDEKDTKVNNNPTSISFFDPWARRWIGDTDWVLLTSPNITLVDERPAQDLISPRGRAALSGKFSRSASRQSGANTSSSSYAFDILSSSDGVIKTTSGRTVHHQHQPSSDASPRLPKGGSAEVLAALGASKVSWKSFHVFVFSDCLLFGKAKKNGVYNFRFKVPLQPPFSVTTGQIAELPSLHGLSIQHPAVPNLRQPKTFCFRSSEECRAWAELLLFKLNTPRNAMLKPLLPPLPGQSFAAASSGTLPSPSSAQCLSGRSIQPSPKDKKQQHQQTSKTNKKKKKYRLSQSGRHLRVRVKSERHDKGHHHNKDREKEKEKEKDKDREKDNHLTGKKKSNRKRPPLLRHYSWGDSSTAINQLADGVALPSKGHKEKGKAEKEKDKAKDKDRERNEAEEPLMVLHKEKRTLNKNSNANKKNSKVATMQQGAPHRDKKDRAKQRASVAFFGHSSLASFDALAEAASSSSSATKTRSHTLENFRSVLPCVNSKDNNSASNGSNSSSTSSKDKDHHKEGNKRNSQKPQKARTSSGSGKTLQQ